MKTALIWGANGGIGSAIANTLIKEGWTVIGISRSGYDAPPGLIAIEADPARPHTLEQAILAASMEVEGVDLWVNAAGDITSEKLSDSTMDRWNEILSANLTGAVAATQASFPLLAEDAHLFYIGAVSERMRLPGLSAYAAAKAGLEAFAETLGKEERKKKITVLRPGAVNTSFWEKVPFKMPVSAMDPAKVAEQLLAAYAEGKKGLVDIQ